MILALCIAGGVVFELATGIALGRLLARRSAELSPAAALAAVPARRRIAVGAVVATALLTASPALGQTSAQDSYSTPAGSVQQRLGDSVKPVPVKTTHSTAPTLLPFTGLDIALVFAASGVLLGMGVSIRRLSRRGA
jgi:hypothetical protein